MRSHIQKICDKSTPPTSNDLTLLRHWDKQTHVIASDSNDDWGWKIELDCDPEGREKLIAEKIHVK